MGVVEEDQGMQSGHKCRHTHQVKAHSTECNLFIELEVSISALKTLNRFLHGDHINGQSHRLILLVITMSVRTNIV